MRLHLTPAQSARFCLRSSQPARSAPLVLTRGKPTGPRGARGELVAEQVAGRVATSAHCGLLTHSDVALVFLSFLQLLSLSLLVILVPF